MSCADDWWDAQADDYQASDDEPEVEEYEPYGPPITDVIRDLADYQPH